MTRRVFCPSRAGQRSRRSKSMSVTGSSTHSCSFKPAPYGSLTLSLGTPEVRAGGPDFFDARHHALFVFLILTEQRRFCRFYPDAHRLALCVFTFDARSQPSPAITSVILRSPLPCQGSRCASTPRRGAYGLDRASDELSPGHSWRYDTMQRIIK